MLRHDGRLRGPRRNGGWNSRGEAPVGEEMTGTGVASQEESPLWEKGLQRGFRFSRVILDPGEPKGRSTVSQFCFLEDTRFGVSSTTDPGRVPDPVTVSQPRRLHTPNHGLESNPTSLLLKPRKFGQRFFSLQEATPKGVTTHYSGLWVPFFSPLPFVPPVSLPLSSSRTWVQGRHPLRAPAVLTDSDSPDRRQCPYTLCSPLSVVPTGPRSDRPSLPPSLSLGLHIKSPFRPKFFFFRPSYPSYTPGFSHVGPNLRQRR